MSHGKRDDQMSSTTKQNENALLLIARLILLFCGIPAAIPLGIALLLLLSTPITLVGFIYLLGCIIIVSGMISAPWWRRMSPALLTLGVVLIFATLIPRLVFPPSGSRLSMVTLPDESQPRWLNRIFDEQDIVVFGARVSPFLGMVTRKESVGLITTFAGTYHKMQGVTPLSPFLTTYLNQQSPQAFDALIAEPASDAPPTRAIIFLHGFGGNFTLQCWLIAHAAEQIGALTICPSTGPAGDWWNPNGKAILQQTLRYLKGRGVQRIYLAGLSNGGIGASRLANALQTDLAGLILISGADPSAPVTGLPVLVVQGSDDERIPTEMVEKYVAKVGAAGTYMLLEGDHFVLLKQADEIQQAILDWLLRQEVRQANQSIRH